MTSQLKPDEQFVISSLAAHLDETWSPGENPPDAYLKMGEETVAVEISTLTQHVIDERGGMKPRLSEDSTALWLANELDKELREAIPDGRMVVLTLRAPIAKARRGAHAMAGPAPPIPDRQQGAACRQAYFGRPRAVSFECDLIAPAFRIDAPPLLSSIKQFSTVEAQCFEAFRVLRIGELAASVVMHRGCSYYYYVAIIRR
jgi:hypothetical protein